MHWNVLKLYHEAGMLEKHPSQNALRKDERLGMCTGFIGKPLLAQVLWLSCFLGNVSALAMQIKNENLSLLFKC